MTYIYSVYQTVAHNIQESWHQEIKKAKGIESFPLTLTPSLTSQVGFGTFEDEDEYKTDNDNDNDGDTDIDDMLVVKDESRDDNNLK